MTQAPATARTVAEVMRHGVVLCDADSSVRSVARAMRDRSVHAVLALDLSGEAAGLVDERDLLRGWSRPDEATAAEVMQAEPLILDPELPVAEAARKMLAVGVARALVAAPPPGALSGRWSDWKERGLPLGMVGIEDLLERAGEIESAARGVPDRRPSVVRRAAPWVAFGSVLGLVLVLGLLVFFYATAHPQVLHPGCSQPTQGGC